MYLWHRTVLNVYICPRCKNQGNPPSHRVNVRPFSFAHLEDIEMTEYSSKQQEDFEDDSDPMEEVSDHLVALAELPVKVIVGGVV